MDERALQLGERTIKHLLWQFSLPAIIGMLANSSYMIINRLFIGNVVGADAISGLSVTMPISLIITAFGMLIGIGSGAMISIRLGQNRPQDAEHILGNALSLLLIISVLVSGTLLFWLDELLVAFGASPNTLPYGRQFISIILLGSAFQYISFGLVAIIRSEGNPRISMGIMLLNAGSLLISDEIKEDAAQAIKQLKQLGVKQLIMLSGDHSKTAANVAEAIGVDQVYAQLLPQDKVAKMQAFKELIPGQQGKLAFVGDGINDAPVLAQSDIGIAMGALGSDAAIEAADVVIMDDHLSKLPVAIRIARFTRNIITQNIVLTLSIKLAVVILGLLGMANLWEAVFADVGAALLAVLNSVRTLGAAHNKADIKSN
jgi:magnesium-transporting ATPase (P-type)